MRQRVTCFCYSPKGNPGNVTGTMFGSWTLVHDDENRLTSVTYPTGTDSFLYNALGQRMRGPVGGTTWRYIYNGDRVMEETNDSGGVLARHTTMSGSYYEPWLHMQRSGGLSRFPLLDGVGTARRLVDAAGTATDAYSLDAFGRYMGGWANPTQNPYRFGAAWRYLTDPSGMPQPVPCFVTMHSALAAALVRRWHLPAQGRRR